MGHRIGRGRMAPKVIMIMRNSLHGWRERLPRRMGVVRGGVPFSPLYGMGVKMYATCFFVAVDEVKRGQKYVP